MIKLRKFYVRKDKEQENREKIRGSIQEDQYLKNAIKKEQR